MYNELLEKIRNRQVVYGVIGLGYVGVPLAAAAASAGIKVIGYDVSGEKVSRINRGESYIEDVSSEELKNLVEKGLLRATTDETELRQADVISICVPTPLNRTREPDMSYIIAASETIRRNSRTGQLIILESTTYPGTTREILLPIMEENGFRVGENVFVAFSPERVDPGNPRYGIRNTPKVVGGVTDKCTELACSFYSLFVEQVHPVSSPEAAELTKLLENIFRAVNIALVNELMLLCDRMGINIWEVIDAAATKPFGYMRFVPGPGLGGHCIPIDPFYLSWKAKQYDFWTEFIELAGRISENIPYYVVDKTYQALNSVNKCLNGAEVLILGLAYKKDIGDMRHSPATKIISLLQKEGARLKAYDPHVRREDYEEAGVEPVELDEKVLESADIVILLTDHSAYDYRWIAEHASLILDTRNAFRDVNPELKRKIWLI